METSQSNSTSQLTVLSVLNQVATAWLILMNACFVYFIATFLDRAECLVCAQPSTRLPVLVWFTSWTLWSSSLVQISGFCLGGPDKWPRWRMVAFQLALPLSIAVSLGYTLYLVTNDWGRDFVDSELCYTMGDLAIPRTASQAWARLFLVGVACGSYTTHYLCAFWNVLIFCKFYPRNSKRAELGQKGEMGRISGNIEAVNPTEDARDSDPEQVSACEGRQIGIFPVVSWMIVHCTIVVVVQEFVDEVYCAQDGTIIQGVVGTLVLVLIFYFIFFGRVNREQMWQFLCRSAKIR